MHPLKNKQEVRLLLHFPTRSLFSFASTCKWNKSVGGKREGWIAGVFGFACFPSTRDSWSSDQWISCLDFRDCFSSFAPPRGLLSTVLLQFQPCSSVKYLRIGPCSVFYFHFKMPPLPNVLLTDMSSIFSVLIPIPYLCLHVPFQTSDGLAYLVYVAGKFLILHWLPLLSLWCNWLSKEKIKLPLPFLLPVSTIITVICGF